MKPPIKGFSTKNYPKGTCTQQFAENPALYASMGMKGHNGADHVAPHGEPMFAVENATVVDVRMQEDGYGRHVRIIGRVRDGVCNEWTYGHCDTILVKVGDTVKEGDQIATMGNTGFVVSDSHANRFWGLSPKDTRGTHLHFGLRKVKRSPKGWSYPGSKIKIEVLNYGNGYKGAVDPHKLFTTEEEKLEQIEEQISFLSKIVEALILKFKK